MLSIKQFNGDRSKVKGFLTQIKLKLQTEKTKFALLRNLVIYARLFLIKRELKWFTPYLTKYQNNRAIIDHLETKFIFIGQDAFAERLTQIYNNLDNKATAEQKLKELTQKSLAMDYTVQFQTYAIQTNWNNKVIISKYKRGLK